MSDKKLEPSVVLPSVPDNIERKWQVYLNGELVPNVRHLRLENRAGMFRCLEYGLMSSEGNSYDSIGYYEAGGGGTVVIPYTMYGEPYVGVVRQQRLFMGPEPVLCAVGGYMKPGGHMATAVEELHDEFRTKALFLNEPFKLPGRPGNCNRAMWIAAAPDEGIHFTAVEVSPAALRVEKHGTLTLRREAVSNAPDVDPNNVEKIISTLFIPAREALLLADMFVVVGTARLMSHLAVERRL